MVRQSALLASLATALSSAVPQPVSAGDMVGMWVGSVGAGMCAQTGYSVQLYVGDGYDDGYLRGYLYVLNPAGDFGYACWNWPNEKTHKYDCAIKPGRKRLDFWGTFRGSTFDGAIGAQVSSSCKVRLQRWPAAAEDTQPAGGRFDGTWQGRLLGCASNRVWQVALSIADGAVQGAYQGHGYDYRFSGSIDAAGNLRAFGPEMDVRGSMTGGGFLGVADLSKVSLGCAQKLDLARVDGPPPQVAAPSPPQWAAIETATTQGAIPDLPRPSGAAAPSASDNAGWQDRLSEGLRALKKLFQDGLITADEFAREKATLLARMLGNEKAQSAQVSASGAQLPMTPADLAGIDFGRYHALVIGNDAYRTLRNLKSAVNDARMVAALLRDDYGFDVSVMENATRHQIVTALSTLRASLRETDNLLIYFAGHGVLDQETQVGYWLPVDAERNTPANWVSNAALQRSLKAMRAKHVMVIADSCFSAALFRSLPNPGVRDGDPRTVIARLAAMPARTVLTSGGLEPVLDGGAGDHSVFAKALLRTLRRNAGVLSGDELFQRVRALVAADADQTPEYAPIHKAGHEGGDFLFVRRGPATRQAHSNQAPQ